MTTTQIQTKTIKLNLGAGNHRTPGWLNVDIVPEFNPDIVEDITVLSTFEPDSVDAILASHVFEHVEDPMNALRRWFEILKPGGELVIICPDHFKAVQLWQKGERFPVLTDNPLVGLMAVATGFYGWLDYQTKSKESAHAAQAQTHRRSFDRPVLSALLELAGFVDREFITERECEAAPQFTELVNWQQVVRARKPECVVHPV